MANEFAVNQADLTAVADAIREKGGTSDALAFPGGFVDAVGAIQAGSGGEDTNAVELSYLALLNRDIAIAGDAFVFPDGVTQIGENMFNATKNTNYIKTLPETVTTIGNNAFYVCGGLGIKAIPDSVTSIGGSAFYNCNLMELENPPAGLTVYNASVFNRCRKIAWTSLPDGVISIGGSAFEQCDNLALTSLPDSITSIGQSAFKTCPKIALKKLPLGLTTVENHTFNGCAGITEMTIHSGVTKLNNYIFSGSGLKTLTIEGKPTMSATTLNGCSNLNAINVSWAEGEVANAPWGATNATINYNYTGG